MAHTVAEACLCALSAQRTRQALASETAQYTSTRLALQTRMWTDLPCKYNNGAAHPVCAVAFEEVTSYSTAAAPAPHACTSTGGSCCGLRPSCSTNG